MFSRLLGDVARVMSRLSHGDAFRQDQLAQRLDETGRLSDKLIDKILSANPRRLYSVDSKIN